MSMSFVAMPWETAESQTSFSAVSAGSVTGQIATTSAPSTSQSEVVYEFDLETGTMIEKKFYTQDMIPMDMSWRDQIIHYPPPGWKDFFHSPECTYAFDHVLRIMISKRLFCYYPLNRDIFAAFWLTPLDKVRVVIFGQDPYYDKSKDGNPKATGLSFSVKPHVRPIPPSLNNIYKAIQRTYPEFKKVDGDLTSWAKQGVLMLNQCLTVEPGVPGSHSKPQTIWMPFLNEVIKIIISTNPKTIFVLWGRLAQDKLMDIIGSQSISLTAPHPSGANVSGLAEFLACEHFGKINEILRNLGSSEIEW